jgi:lipopolysaccharide export system permease protein
MKIYERYFYKEISKVFFLFLGCFYFLYVLIDMSLHLKTLQRESVPIYEMIKFAFLQWTKMAEILIPFAMLIATIKVLTTLNLKNELVALVTSGIPLKRLLRPFFIFALFCGFLLYLNFQFLQPLALPSLHHFEETYFKGKKENGSNVNHLMIENGTENPSLLIYQNFNPETRSFFDVFWMINHDEIYRIKTLYPFEKVAVGHFVDYLIRDANGEIVKKKSVERLTFPNLKLNQKTLFTASSPAEWKSLSQLVGLLSWKEPALGLNKTSDKRALLATLAYAKLLLPLLSVLSVLAIGPFCIKFNRNLSIFLIYALGLFAQIAFFMLIRASSILGTSQVLAPLIICTAPYLLFFSIFGFRFAKL